MISVRTPGALRRGDMASLCSCSLAMNPQWSSRSCRQGALLPVLRMPVGVTRHLQQHPAFSLNCGTRKIS
eukprot:10818641-Lingulodinium_polyedra.AAC.1